MSMRNMGQRVLQNVFLGYLKLLEKTVKIDWQEEELCGNSQIFGFWHEDSFFMNLVLKNLAEKTAPVDVVVTADTRGDYIQYMIEKCGGSTLRIPDGYAAFGALKKLMQTTYEQTRSMAVALDGPLGPRQEPKKLAFYLSEQKGEDFVGITLRYSLCFRMLWRWDRYVIPLPFTKVTVAVKDYGEVSKKAIPDLPVRAEIFRESSQQGLKCKKMIRDTLRYQKMM